MFHFAVSAWTLEGRLNADRIYRQIRQNGLSVPGDISKAQALTAKLIIFPWSTLAHLKVKIIPPHFNGNDFWRKANFSGWCVRTIICNFVSSENDILLAFHFVDQFLKIWFPCFIYIPSSQSGTQLFSVFDWKFFCCYLTETDSVARYEKWFPDTVFYQFFS